VDLKYFFLILVSGGLGLELLSRLSLELLLLLLLLLELLIVIHLFIRFDADLRFDGDIILMRFSKDQQSSKALISHLYYSITLLDLSLELTAGIQIPACSFNKFLKFKKRMDKFSISFNKA
jgi:hypothetical protein